MQLPRLETERLIIRPLTTADAGALDLAVEEVQPGWLEWTAATYEQLEALHQPPYGERAIGSASRRAGRPGRSGAVDGPLRPAARVRPRRRGPARLRPEVGLFWSLAPGHRGHGYATEAARAVIEHGFRVLELARFVATAERDNAASIAVMRRLGMRVEENPLPEPPWFQVVGWGDASLVGARHGPTAVPGTAYIRAYSGPLPPSGGVSRPPLAVIAPHWTQLDGAILTSHRGAAVVALDLVHRGRAHRHPRLGHLAGHVLLDAYVVRLVVAASVA